MKASTYITVAFVSVNVLCVILFAYGDILEAKFKNSKEYIEYHFPYGSRIQLYCVQDTSDGMVIKNSSNITVSIVQDSKLQEQFSDKYLFEVINSTTGLFTIKELTMEFNNTQFLCENQRIMTATVYVFNPINNSELICSSSYGSRYIFEDLMINHIEYNCTSEDGDPPVKMSAYIRLRGENNDVTSNSSLIESSHPHRSKTLLLSSKLTSSFNNSVFVCNVSQQLPGQYQSESYQGSCSFGPLLLLPSFSASVIPSNITVNKSDDIILTCISNVSEVIFDWSNIPSDWETNIKRGNDFSELHITDYGTSVTSVIVECIVTYGDRTITEHVNVSVQRNPWLRGFPIGIFIVCIVLIITVTTTTCLVFRVYLGRNAKTSKSGSKKESSAAQYYNVPDQSSENYIKLNSSSSVEYDSGGYLSPRDVTAYNQLDYEVVS